MTERASDRWISIAWSVVLHAGLVALLAYGWWSFKQQPNPQPAVNAIDAVVVDSKSVSSSPRPRPRPEPEPEPQPPPEPQPTPEEVAQQEQAEREAAEKAAQEQREAEEKRKAEEQRIAEEQRLAEEKRIADERAEAERKAREEAERRAREAEEAKRREEERKLAEQKRIEEEKRRAEEKRKAEEARLAAQREAELRKSIEEEERLMAARSSGAMASWIQQITAKIQRAWIRPPSARAGIDCTLLVSQVPGGEIVNVRIASCNGDQAVRESIEAAAYRASPLPPPPDPALFERNLEIRFRPVD